MSTLIRRAFFGGSAPSSVVADLGFTVLRVGAGLAMALAHGLGKVPPPDRFIGGVEAMGFPAPVLFAWAAGLAELVGGVLLALGLMTRPAALSLVVTMMVAFFIRHGADPFQQKELAFLFLIITVAFTAAGSGRFGLDRFIRGSATG